MLLPEQDGQQAQTAAAAATPATASASDVQQADAFKAEGTPGELVPMTRFMTSTQCSCRPSHIAHVLAAHRTSHMLWPYIVFYTYRPSHVIRQCKACCWQVCRRHRGLYQCHQAEPEQRRVFRESVGQLAVFVTPNTNDVPPAPNLQCRCQLAAW